MPSDRRENLELMARFRALEAKIIAVAAYVASMPGAEKINIDEIKQILRSPGIWPPANPFGKADSPLSSASSVLIAMHNIANSEKAPEKE